MTWTATLKSLRNEKVRWTYTIIYSDGVDSFSKDYQSSSISDSLLSGIARNEVAILQGAKNSVGAVSYSEGQQIDISSPATPTKTSEQIASEQFQVKRMELRALMDAARDGIIEVTDPRIIALQTALAGGI